MMTPAELRCRIEDFYADYTACLDDGPLERWPDFFTTDGIYELLSRENAERGSALPTMRFLGRGGLKDRVEAIKDALMFIPHYQRHLIGPLRLTETEDGILVRSNYLVVRTRRHELSEILSTGQYQDLVVFADGAPKFHRKLAVYDSELIPNSLVYPI